MLIDKSHIGQELDNLELKITKDGSHTYYVKDLDETYHSVHGAIQEAQHVFIKAGLEYVKSRNELNVLEVGLGTGLNAFLTYTYAAQNNLVVDYTSIEAYPLSWNEIEQLNYTSELGVDGPNQNIFRQIHESEWEKCIQLSKSFCLKKIKTMLEEYSEQNTYDIIYFDAFGPRVQPELWEEPILKNMFKALKKDGVLVTYCAKGAVKRTLKNIGFVVESLPGPPGKREMTRALKK